jgi:hypothetical protein
MPRDRQREIAIRLRHVVAAQPDHPAEGMEYSEPQGRLAGSRELAVTRAVGLLSDSTGGGRRVGLDMPGIAQSGMAEWRRDQPSPRRGYEPRPGWGSEPLHLRPDTYEMQAVADAVRARLGSARAAGASATHAARDRSAAIAVSSFLASAFLVTGLVLFVEALPRHAVRPNPYTGASLVLAGVALLVTLVVGIKKRKAPPSGH